MAKIDNEVSSLAELKKLISETKGRYKYHNKKTEVDGITFDSKKEADRYGELRLMERQGLIRNLQRQVKYVLIPEMREPSQGKKKGKIIERECAYSADFVYENAETGETVVEDTKGVRTKEYIIKRKLMLHIHGIRIREI